MGKFEAIKNSWELIKKDDPIAAFVIRGLGALMVLTLIPAVVSSPEEKPEPEPNRYNQLAPEYKAEELKPDDQVAFHRLATLTPDDVKAARERADKRLLGKKLQSDLAKTSLGLLQNPDGPRTRIDEYSLSMDLIREDTQTALENASIDLKPVLPVPCGAVGLYLNPLDFSNNTADRFQVDPPGWTKEIEVPIGAVQQTSEHYGAPKDLPTGVNRPLSDLAVYDCSERPQPVVSPDTIGKFVYAPSDSPYDRPPLK